MIASGALSPLEGFMGREDYERVLDDMHLANGLPWALPVCLAVDKAPQGDRVVLADGDGVPLAVLEVEEVYEYDQEREAERSFRTTDEAHPGVARLYAQQPLYLAGRVTVFTRPEPAFPELAMDPAETRALFAERGWKRVVGFQTRNPIHRAHEYLTKGALETVDGLLIHPLVGETKSDDVPAATRVECYRVLVDNYYPADRVVVSAFPAAMRYAGPREAIWHAICRKNYGCSHFIVGRDHAGVGDYYGTYDAQLIFDEFEPHELGIETMFFEHAFWCRACGSMATPKTCPHGGDDHVFLSGTKVRELLQAGRASAGRVLAARGRRGADRGLPMSRRRLSSYVAIALVAVVVGGIAAFGGDAQAGRMDTKLTLVAYSTPREAYAKLIPAFAETQAGHDTSFDQSYGASGEQARAVIAGLKADVVALSLEPDMTSLVKAGLVARNWKQDGYEGIVTRSVVVFAVRKGNPKKIRTWADLIKPGVDIVTPNVQTSGGAKWNVMAAYGAQRKAGKTHAQAVAYLTKFYDHIVSQDKSAREALQTFIAGRGDVSARVRKRGDLREVEGAGPAVRDPEGDDQDREPDRGHDELLEQDEGEGVPPLSQDRARAAHLRPERLPTRGQAGPSWVHVPGAAEPVLDQVPRGLGEGGQAVLPPEERHRDAHPEKEGRRLGPWPSGSRLFPSRRRRAIPAPPSAWGSRRRI